MVEEIEIEFDESIFLPVYRPLLDCESDIIFLWGGRDSGKSHFIAQRLIKKCLEADYFRCVLIKKTYDSIKDSQWTDIRDQVSDMGLDDFFHFTQNPLQITCTNGNKFIARGCDNPKKLKSIKNPTDAWFEEGDQISEEDHTVIQTSLRSNRSRIQQWFSFNPEADGTAEPREFWLYKSWVGNRYDRFTETKEIEYNGKKLPITFTSWHTTFDDNPYCTDQRKAIHESLKYTDPYYYQVYRHGHWGKREVSNPFLHTFSREKHVSTIAQFDPKKIVYITIDFNLDPFCVSFSHIWNDNQGPHYHKFDQIKIKGGSIDKLCEVLETRYGRYKYNFIITGDYSGKKRSIEQKDHADLYTQLKRNLGLLDRQFILKPNPTHKTSRSDCNYLFFHHPDIKINPDTCPDVIYDCETVEVDHKHQIIKSDRAKKEQQADMLDGVRYDVNTFFKDWILKHQKGLK